MLVCLALGRLRLLTRFYCSSLFILSQLVRLHTRLLVSYFGLIYGHVLQISTYLLHFWSIICVLLVELGWHFMRSFFMHLFIQLLDFSLLISSLTNLLFLIVRYFDFLQDILINRWLVYFGPIKCHLTAACLIVSGSHLVDVVLTKVDRGSYLHQVARLHWVKKLAHVLHIGLNRFLQLLAHHKFVYSLRFINTRVLRLLLIVFHLRSLMRLLAVIQVELNPANHLGGPGIKHWSMSWVDCLVVCEPLLTTVNWSITYAVASHRKVSVCTLLHCRHSKAIYILVVF